MGFQRFCGHNDQSERNLWRKEVFEIKNLSEKLISGPPGAHRTAPRCSGSSWCTTYADHQYHQGKLGLETCLDCDISMMKNSLAGPQQHASVSQIKDIPKSKGSQLGVNATENWKHASCGIRSAVGTCNAESGDCPSNKHSTMVCCAEQ